MNPYDIGDPTATTSKQVSFGGDRGVMRILNSSPYALRFSTNGTQYTVPPDCNRDLPADASDGNPLKWTIPYQKTNAASASTNFVVVEAYDQGEPLPPLPPPAGPGLMSITGSTVTVIANELGSVDEGIGVQSLPAHGLGAGMDAFALYSTTAGANRDLALYVLNGGVATQAMRLFANLIASFPGGLLVPAAVASSLDNGALASNGAGLLTTYGGVATAGKGVPPIVADTGVAGVAVAVTTQQTILSFTPAANGMYRVGARLRLNNGTSGQTITLQVSFTDADSGLAQLVSFFGNGGGSALSVLGALAGVVNGVYALAPLDIKAKAGTAITVIYRDAGGTPNDIVNANMQWLA